MQNEAAIGTTLDDHRAISPHVTSPPIESGKFIAVHQEEREDILLPALAINTISEAKRVNDLNSNISSSYNIRFPEISTIPQQYDSFRQRERAKRGIRIRYKVYILT